MNYYVRYFDEETLVASMDEVIDFLSNIDDIDMTPDLIQELNDYANSDVFFPKRYKVRSRVYFIIIKTEAATMQDFKDKKALRPVAHKPVDDILNEELEGWYEATLSFKRVVMNHNGKCEYRDTSRPWTAMSASWSICAPAWIHAHSSLQPKERTITTNSLDWQSSSRGGA